MKIRGSGLGSTTTAGQAPWIPTPSTAQHPMSILLFGKRPPRLLDRRRFPKLRRALRKLEEVKDQIAGLLGVPGNEFEVELCEGSNAAISREGRIAVGVELLERHQQDDDLMVAVMGHEIGHQPWTWPEGDMSGLTRKKLDAIYREEEAKADRFAGRVLADLGADPDSVCRFLTSRERFEAHKPSDYYPAKVRAAMIRRACSDRLRALERNRTVREMFGRGVRDLR